MDSPKQGLVGERVNSAIYCTTQMGDSDSNSPQNLRWEGRNLEYKGGKYTEILNAIG